MEWKSIKDKSHEQCRHILAVVRYIDFPFDVNDTDFNEPYLTAPQIEVRSGYFPQSRGGIVTHWMELPEMPRE